MRPGAAKPRRRSSATATAIEKLVFQSRPDVWVTANAYVPVKDGQRCRPCWSSTATGPGRRSDPVVQARCLGLVKLGFFVLAVDAFGAGERTPSRPAATYHGALYGSTLWPTGHTLLGHAGLRQPPGRRLPAARRQEVNGKLGITGASPAAATRRMYAGALDERFEAVVPVCSVGNYQAYLQAACCVCEVLPGALTFTEEGDVLGLVAPRALLVINATRDGIQFSPAEAEKSVGPRQDDLQALRRADEGAARRRSSRGHDYNQPMREAMYGWMTRALKGEGKGEPIPEPEHTHREAGRPARATRTRTTGRRGS